MCFTIEIHVIRVSSILKCLQNTTELVSRPLKVLLTPPHTCNRFSKGPQHQTFPCSASTEQPYFSSYITWSNDKICLWLQKTFDWPISGQIWKSVYTWPAQIFLDKKYETPEASLGHVKVKPPILRTINSICTTTQELRIWTLQPKKHFYVAKLKLWWCIKLVNTQTLA